MNDHKKEETMLPDWMCSGETYVQMCIRDSPQGGLWAIFAFVKLNGG